MANVRRVYIVRLTNPDQHFGSGLSEICNPIQKRGPQYVPFGALDILRRMVPIGGTTT